MKKQVNVLIVEDSDNDAKLALRMLQRGGFEPTSRRVQTAAEFATALAAGRWDAVISDFNLPGFTGMDALRIFRATGLDIPFILISGTVGEEIAVDAMKAGANDYIVKMNLSRLSSVMERELQEAENRAAHKRAEEKQREVNQMLDNIVENIPTAVQLKSVHDGMRIQMWNKAAEAMYGVPRDAAVGSNVHDLWPRDDADRMHASDLDLLARGGVQDFPDRLAQTKHRGTIHVHMRKVALLDAGGKATHLLVVADDISAQFKHVEDLRRFRAAMDISVDAIVLIDRASMRYIDVNQTVCDMAGRTRQELLGTTPMALLGESREALERDYDALIANSGNAADKVEGQYHRKDGSLMSIETRRRALHTENGWIIVGTTRDITERKLADEVLRKRAEELERFHRLSVGREMQMIELKKQINETAKLKGQKPPYDLAFLEPKGVNLQAGHGKTS